jgi:ABC-type cobalt transport system substrate-binding protein
LYVLALKPGGKVFVLEYSPPHKLPPSSTEPIWEYKVTEAETLLFKLKNTANKAIKK